MLTIEEVDTDNKAQVKRFVELPYRLYKDCPQWVPPLYVDAYMYLNRRKHPFWTFECGFFPGCARWQDVVGVLRRETINPSTNIMT